MVCLTREVVSLEASAPSWADLAPLLGRAEWRGEIRRGYFVEGLSGVQYALEEAALELGRLGAASQASRAPGPCFHHRPGEYLRRRRPAGYRAIGGGHCAVAASRRQLPGSESAAGRS